MNDNGAPARDAAANSPADHITGGRGRFAPPAIVITFELESRPSVHAAWSTDSDDERMSRWFDQHPEYERLIFEAVELSGEAA